MSIWFQDFTLNDLQRISVNTMVEHLGIEFTEIGPDFIKAKMPVDKRTVQPAGLLHGGASVSLAETLGSVGAYLCVDPAKYDCVGIEINANHLRPMRQGFVIGSARPLHLGGRIQVWEIRISNEQEQPVCVSRITIAVVAKQR